MLSKSIEQYLDELASTAPTPSGGSTVGIMSALASSLALMAINVSVANKKNVRINETNKDRVLNLVKELEKSAENFKVLAESDAKVFDAYMKAKEEDKEKAMDACFKVPYMCANECVKAIEIMKELSPYITKSIVSDMVIGFMMLKSCFEASIVNARINERWINKMEISKMLNDFIVMNKDKVNNIVEHQVSLFENKKKEPNVLEGKTLASKMKEDIKKQINEYKDRGFRNPKLVVIQMVEDDGSEVYLNARKKLGNNLGIEVERIFIEDATNEKVQKVLKQLNEDESVDGIIIDKPYAKGISDDIGNYIEPSKDVDGVSSINLGYLMQSKSCFVPCTAAGVMRLLDYHNIDVNGKNVAVMGRSLTVGKPLSIMLTNRNATVTTIHSKTKNSKEICKNSDIVVVAIGKREFVNEEYVNNNTIIVDVGIHYSDEGKVVGDVKRSSIENIVEAYSPVPGGVGSLTSVILMSQTMESYLERMITIDKKVNK